MSKRCPHCDGEIRPSVVKCRHCGRNVSDPPEARTAAGSPPESSVPPSVGGGQGESAVSPIAAAVEATLDPAPPPAGIAFKPPVAVVPIQAMTPDPTAAPATSSVAMAPASDVQDWGTPEGKTPADPYWQVKAASPAQVAAGGEQVEVAQKTDPKATVSAVLLLTAGVIGIVASLQPWVSTSASGLRGVEDEVRRGFSGWEGKVTVALGVACLILALVSFVRKDAGSLKIGLAAGLGIVGVGVYTLLTATSQFVATLVSAREVEGMREDAARGLVTGWRDSGVLKVSPQTGLYLVIGAGVVACIAGLLALSVKPSPPSPAKTSRGPGS